MNKPERVSVFLICGFLGAGKTTLLRHLLSSPKEGEKVAVLVNEFGDISLDGDLIRRDGLEMIELANGCICCSLRIDFRLALQKIVREIRPHTLYVEATGIAQPPDLLEALSAREITSESRLEALITIVDAHFFRIREVLGPFYNKQLECADLILINKSDLVNREKLEEITEQVRWLNPRAVLLPTRFCHIDHEILLSGRYFSTACDVHLTSGKMDYQEQHGKEACLDDAAENRPPAEEEHRHEEGEDSEPRFQSFFFRHKEPLDRGNFFRFMESLPLNVFRCKGYVRFENESIFVNYTAGRFSVEKTPEQSETRLVFVGLDINSGQLSSQLVACKTGNEKNPET